MSRATFPETSLPYITIKEWFKVGDAIDFRQIVVFTTRPISYLNGLYNPILSED